MAQHWNDRFENRSTRDGSGNDRWNRDDSRSNRGDDNRWTDGDRNLDWDMDREFSGGRGGDWNTRLMRDRDLARGTYRGGDVRNDDRFGGGMGSGGSYRDEYGNGEYGRTFDRFSGGARGQGMGDMWHRGTQGGMTRGDYGVDPGRGYSQTSYGYPQEGGRGDMNRGDMNRADMNRADMNRGGGDWTRSRGGGDDHRGFMERMGDKLGDMGRRMGRGPKGYKRSDERIYEEICERIARYDVNADHVEVKVTNGEVMLTGMCEDRRDKRMIEDLCDEVFGVEEVHNQIRVSRGMNASGNVGGTTASSMGGTNVGGTGVTGSGVTGTNVGGTTGGSATNTGTTTGGTTGRGDKMHS